MKFEKGNKGKPKGATNLLNRTVKETVLSVFNDIQSNPKVNLRAFAIKYPRDFYAIAAKLIPTEVTAKIDNKITLHIVRSNTGITPITSGPGDGIDLIEEV